MFEPVIAIIGLIWIAFKLLSDKGKTENLKKEVDNRIKKYNYANETFLNEVIDVELEQSVLDNISKYNDIIEKAWNEMSEIKDMERIGGMHIDILNRKIVMAEYGKILEKDATFGIKNGIYLTHEQMEKEKKSFNIFMKWLDGKLQSKGVEPMVYSTVQQMQGVYDNEFKYVQDKDDNDMSAGVYYWMSSSHYVSPIER